jgi:hypothetical protein
MFWLVSGFRVPEALLYPIAAADVNPVPRAYVRGFGARGLSSFAQHFPDPKNYSIAEFVIKGSCGTG